MEIAAIQYKENKAKMSVTREKIKMYSNKKDMKYDKKLEHYRTQQLSKTDPNNRSFKPTKVPWRLHDFEELCIFKTPSELPDIEPPLGPYICDRSIKLSKEELLS